MEKYFFFLGTLYFAIITLIMYIRMPSHRRGMIILGLSIFWTGLVAEYFWFIRDWWHPETITGTIIGPEDFIFSFTHVIIPIFIYKFVFRRANDKNLELTKNLINASIRRILFCFFLPFAVAGVLFGIFHISSVISVSIGFILAGFLVLLKRKDLLSEMLWSALLMVVITVPIYLILEFVLPGSIQKLWYFSKLTGITFLKIPIEDMLFYLLLGFAMGGLYEYIFDLKLIKKSQS